MEVATANDSEEQSDGIELTDHLWNKIRYIAVAPLQPHTLSKFTERFEKKIIAIISATTKSRPAYLIGRAANTGKKDRHHNPAYVYL